MTRVVGIVNFKGGCGKSTIATHLAVAFARAGLASGLADLDRQKSAISWDKLRPKGVAKIEVLDWTKDIADRYIGLQRLVLDTPAAMRPREVAHIISLCDALVIPILPSVFDELSTRRFLQKIQKIKQLRKGRIAVHLIGNRYRANSRAAERLHGFLESIGQTMTATIPDRAIYNDLAAHGLTLFDAKTKSARQLQEDWIRLLEQIEIDFAERDARLLAS